MSDNELMQFDNANLPSNPDDLLQGLQTAVAQSPAGSGSGLFIKITKMGQWIYGPENIEVEEGSLWAVNPTSFVSGFINWDTRDDVTQLYGEVMQSAFKPPIDPDSLPEHANGEWRPQMGFTMQCINGEDEGTSVIYKNTSVGCLQAVRDLMASVAGQLQKDKVNYVPVVALEYDSYEHSNKKYGTIVIPIFKIVKWVSMDGISKNEPEKVEAPQELETNEAEEPAPQTGRRSQSSEDSQENTGSRRRRRNR